MMNNTTSTLFKHQTRATNQSKAAATPRPPIQINLTTPTPTRHLTIHKNEVDLKVGKTDKTIGPTVETTETEVGAETEVRAETDTKIGAEAGIGTKIGTEVGTEMTAEETAVTDKTMTTEGADTKEHEHALLPEEKTTSPAPQQAQPTYPPQSTHPQHKLQKTKTLH